MPIPEFPNLVDHFLLAMPGLQNSIFASSLTYIFEHSEAGAAGLVVNKAVDMNLHEVFQQLELPTDGSKANDIVLAGGPVSLHQGFVLHKDGEWADTLKISDGVSVSTSLDILRSLASDQGPEKAVIVLGYAGWSPGQLEQELSENVWLTVKANPDIIFDTPMSERASVAALQLGFDINKLGLDAGHA